MDPFEQLSLFILQVQIYLIRCVDPAPSCLLPPTTSLSVNVLKCVGGVMVALLLSKQKFWVRFPGNVILVF